MLPLKFLLLGLGKYLPLPFCQTLWEHGVDVPVKLPDGSVTTRKAKLLPRWSEIRANWKLACKDSLLALWHRHVIVRFFTNVCETCVKVILVSRWLYGVVRRRTAPAYRMLYIPHSDEADHFSRVRDLYITGILRHSAAWIWHSVKLYERTSHSGTIEVSPYRKLAEWRMVKFDGWMYAVKVPSVGSARWRRTFRAPYARARLIVESTGEGSLVLFAEPARADGESARVIINR